MAFVYDGRSQDADIRGRILQLETHTSGSLNVKSYGAKGDGVADDTAAVTAWRDALAALAAAGQVPRGVIPAGVYKVSASPNFAIQNLHVECQGDVRWRYTGTGNALIFDGGGSGFVFGVRFGRIVVEAPSSALHGIYARSLHHSIIDARVRGAGSASAGLRVEFAVVTQFPHFVCSSNDDGWYASAQPKYGISLGQRNANEQASYCLFQNPIVEHVSDTGLYLEDALGNVFQGGTSEGNGVAGVNVLSGSFMNRFYGTDFESNPVGGGLGIDRGNYAGGTTYALHEYAVYGGQQYVSLQGSNTGHQPDVSPTWWQAVGTDILLAGYENEFHGVDSTAYVRIAGANAKRNLFLGGHFHIVSIYSGATRNVLRDCQYNRAASGGMVAGGALFDDGLGNSFPGCYDAGQGPQPDTSSDRGDANVTLTRGDARVQRFATALTVNRTITLPSSGLPGDTFRIVRTGLGAFTLDVGGLKTLPSATAAWAEVTYDGVAFAWRLAGYGTL